ncbi:putative bifunctional diguanylate cyclase/phosphodiesterase [Litchfieldella rifensis]|uniref:Bifunctional diguanylate cyclase/phosphodiesterase n=1 Tax=Litchfieldella rifensis TaxID=762643 RepID=A0ABV7LMI1_9GAMM
MPLRTRLLIVMLTVVVLTQLATVGIILSAIDHISRDTLLAAYRELQWQLPTIFVVNLAVATLVAVLSIRTISRSLGIMADTVRRIGRGHRFSRLEVPRKGELGLLADALMTMQEDIARREATLLHQSRHDLLTGLSNRTLAQADIERDIATGRPFTLLRLAIDDFRRINDTFGYALGDRVLITLAERLAKLPSPVVDAYRLGGDEFLLRLDIPACPEAWLKDLHQRLSQPIDTHDSPIRPALSLGEVRFPEHGDSPHLLLRRADIALAMARHSHQRHQLYLEGQDERHLRQLTLIRDLHDAVSQQQLTVVYQPKVRTDSGEVVQFEALMRWQHPTLGFIPPDEFITLAERSGNIHLLSQWMIDAVGKQLQSWGRQGHTLRVAVNLSAADVMDESLPDRLLQMQAEYRLTPDQLGLEVTESAIMKDPALATRVLGELRHAGMTVAVDDFGAGYSSLAQLKRLPVQELKIDKSFILRLEDHSDDEVIVRSTIELGHNLGLKVVAEGVDTPQGRELLQRLGCDYLQGYLISRPLPADQVLDWLDDYRRRHAAPSP